MSEGWIKLHRQLKEWQHYQEPFVLLVWIDLLLSANSKAAWVRGHRIGRGELITSVARIMASTGIGSDNTVREALRKLEESGEIRRERIGIGTKVTINQFNKFQSYAENAQPTAQLPAQPTAEVGAQPTAQSPVYKQEYKEGKEEKNLRKKEDEDDNRASDESVVVGLLDFMKNVFGDFNFTPSQVQLIMSKPPVYWDYFMNEIEASKWLRSKDPALALRLHEKVVNGDYRTYKDTAKPEPTIPQPIQHQPTKEELYVKQLVEEWETLVNTDPVGATYPKLNELRLKHGQLPSAFLEEIGMQYYAGGWHFKY